MDNIVQREFHDERFEVIAEWEGRVEEEIHIRTVENHDRLSPASPKCLQKVVCKAGFGDEDADGASELALNLPKKREQLRRGQFGRFCPLRFHESVSPRHPQCAVDLLRPTVLRAVRPSTEQTPSIQHITNKALELQSATLSVRRFLVHVGMKLLVRCSQLRDSGQPCFGRQGHSCLHGIAVLADKSARCREASSEPTSATSSADSHLLSHTDLVTAVVR